MKIDRILRSTPIALAAILASGAFAQAATITNGTKITCIIHKGIDSTTLQQGADFKLHVDDLSEPDLAGAVIVGHVTNVTGAAGMTRASVAFVFDYILFKNGTKAPFHAAVLSKNVTQTNTAQADKERVKFSLPPMTTGTVTPGPVAWQMNFGGGAKPSMTAAPVGNSGGVVYAQKPNEAIVIPPGSAVTLQLTADLTTP